MGFTDYHGLIGILRARQDELGLSNARLEEICGLTQGHWDKMVGPSQVRMPNFYTLMLVMDGLGLSFEAPKVDPAKVERMSRIWARQSGRRSDCIRDERTKLSKEIIKKARAVVRREDNSRAAKSRWDRVSKEKRREIARALIKIRWDRAKGA